MFSKIKKFFDWFCKYDFKITVTFILAVIICSFAYGIVHPKLDLLSFGEQTCSKEIDSINFVFRFVTSPFNIMCEGWINFLLLIPLLIIFDYAKNKQYRKEAISLTSLGSSYFTTAIILLTKGQIPTGISIIGISILSYLAIKQFEEKKYIEFFIIIVILIFIIGKDIVFVQGGTSEAEKYGYAYVHFLGFILFLVLRIFSDRLEIFFKRAF